MILVDSFVSKKGSKNKKKKKKKSMKAKGCVNKKKVKKVAPKGTCFHCDQDGHWMGNCTVYLLSLKKKASDVLSTSLSMTTND